jgi:RNA polymerase sigma-70 factor (ECF subfamily)
VRTASLAISKKIKLELKPNLMAVNMAYHQSAFRLDEEMKLVERAKEDPRYFAPLYERYHEAIFRYVFKRVDEIENAYDITSCVFIKAMGSIQKYENRGVPFSSWLFRIAKSELYQSFRDKKARRTVSIDSVTLKQVMDDFTDDSSEENRAKLLKAMGKLKEAQLQLIEMRFFEKRSFREIGEIVGLSENNAKVKTFRALLKLKELFYQKE